MENNIEQELYTQKEACTQEMEKLEAFKNLLVERSKQMQAQFNAANDRISELRGKLEAINAIYKNVIGDVKDKEAKSDLKAKPAAPEVVSADNNKKLSKAEKEAINNINKNVNNAQADLPDYLKQ